MAFSAVVTTGIYCRPGCGARPRADNVRTFSVPAAAEAAGYRACLRCRPYRVGGSAPWEAPELVCRAIQLIIGGALDRGGEAELGARIGLSARHLRRLFHEHLGITPDQFARSRRAHFARRLLDDTDLGVAEVAFASGFGSLRQFNRAMREIFRASPRELRARRRRTDRLAADGGLALRLPVCAPYDAAAVLALLSRQAVAGVEVVGAGSYRRTIALDGDPGLVEVALGADPGHLLVRLHLPYWEGLIHVVERLATVFGADLDVGGAAAALAADPLLGPRVRARPGLRMPGAWSALEVAVAAAVAEHHDRDGAAELMGLLVRELGQPVPGLPAGLTHLFPSADALAAGAKALVPDATAAAISAVCAPGLLDPGRPLDEVVACLTDTGLQAPSAQRVALRLGHLDAFPEDLAADAERWRPWRGVAAAHLLHATLPEPS